MVLDRQHGDKTRVVPATEALVREKGRYLYCVADAAEQVSLGEIGIDGNQVYTIPYRDLGAVVHNCPAQPYQSADREPVKAWLITHQAVVDAAWERWGTVLPLSFDTIIREETERGAEQNVRDWLSQEYQRLKSTIQRVRGKVEYGVQVSWDPRTMAQNLVITNQEMSRLNEEIKTKPRGLAYIYRQKLENLIKQEMGSKADECFKSFYRRIRQHSDDVRVEKAKKAEPGWQMILNLSCLVYRDRYSELGEELDQIDRMAGFSVRFTGPWPPYSFVGGG